MATITELVYDVRESLNLYQDDTNVSDRYITHLWNTKRSKYLRQDLNNYQKTVDNSILQSFCIEMIEVPINECGLSYDCGTILRSKYKIPKPIELHLKSAITAIKPTNRMELPFNYVGKERAIVSKHSPFKKSIYAFLDDDLHIYIISQNNLVKLIECVTVTGIFENPLDLAIFKNCCGCSDAVTCFDEDTTEYPLQSHHIDTIREEIKLVLKDKLQIPEDKINDGETY